MSGDVQLDDAFALALDADGEYVAVLNETTPLPTGLAKTVVADADAKAAVYGGSR